MTHINLFFLLSVLFGVHYFLTTFIITEQDTMINFAQYELIPFSAFLMTSQSYILVSNYYVLEFSLALMFVAQLIQLVIPYTLSKGNNHLISIGISALNIILLLSHIVIPPVVLKILLLILGGVIMLIMYLKFRQNENESLKDLIEIQIINIIGLCLLQANSTMYMLNLALFILLIYQIVKLILLRKNYFTRYNNQLKRLSDLEGRFERVVDFETKKRTSRMVEKVEIIREKSQKDPMTKTLNRYGLTTEISNMIQDSSTKIFSIAIFDIDFFKSINDSFGHIVGDECLKFLSYTFMINCKKSDLLGRYGGDEFILIMPHTNAPECIQFCDRVRQEIKDKSKPHFTISTGISTYPYDGRSFAQLLDIADKGLYISKEKGRNTVSYVGNVIIPSQS